MPADLETVHAPATVGRFHPDHPRYEVTWWDGSPTRGYSIGNDDVWSEWSADGDFLMLRP